jgi:hypothetical protein
MDIAMLRDMHKEMTFAKVMETVPVWIETEIVGYDDLNEPEYGFLDVRGLPELVYFAVIYADLDDHLELVQKLKASNGHGIAYDGFDSEDLEAEFEEEGFLIRFTAYDVEVLSVDIDEDLRECTFYCSATLGAEHVGE